MRQYGMPHISWPLAAVILTSVGSLAVPSYGAPVAAVTCHGLAATIVSYDSAAVTGTSGPDVIVLLHGGSALAGAGDDVICANGMASYVDAGPGDDLADTTTVPSANVSGVDLGEGADTFLGGSGEEVVRTGPTPGNPTTPAPDLDRDIVSTGGGGDTVLSGSVGLPNEDSLVMGPGDDSVVLAPLSPAGVLDVGSGRNTLSLDLASGAPAVARIDAAARLVTWRNESVPWAGRMTRFVVSGSPDVPLLLEVEGSSHGEIMELFESREVDARIRLRAGDDKLLVRDRTGVGSQYLMGPGTDTVMLNWVAPQRTGAPNPRLRVDLEAHRVDYGESDRQAELRGAETLRLNGVHVSVHGDESANRVSAIGCVVRISGGSGPDFLRRGPLALGYGQEPSADCPGAGRLAGGPGADRLVGTDGTDDVLIGGGGRDIADGRAGLDRCRAEVARNCEDAG